jgi:hypothetical protein
LTSSPVVAAIADSASCISAETRQWRCHGPAAHPDRAEILDLHQQTVRAFGLTAGVTHMEFLKTTGGLTPAMSRRKLLSCLRNPATC